MKEALPVALALLTAVALATGSFAQPFTSPRQDTAPSTAPTGEKATKVKKTGEEAIGREARVYPRIRGEEGRQEAWSESPQGWHPSRAVRGGWLLKH